MEMSEDYYLDLARQKLERQGYGCVEKAETSNGRAAFELWMIRDFKKYAVGGDGFIKVIVTFRNDHDIDSHSEIIEGRGLSSAQFVHEREDC
jgi:hypothetical protein